MDKNGIGLDEIYSSDDGTWWRHICECGHFWDSLLQVDTCWLCYETSISAMDQATADIQDHRLETEDVPDNLLRDVD